MFLLPEEEKYIIAKSIQWFSLFLAKNLHTKFKVM